MKGSGPETDEWTVSVILAPYERILSAHRFLNKSKLVSLVSSAVT
jgi:hypothetical protein